MPILDTTAREKSLKNNYGPTRGANSPASFTVHLYVGDPLLDGTEMPNTTTLEDLTVVANGYAAVTISNDNFVVDDLGMTQTVTFGAALAEWPDSATHWLLRDSVTLEGWDCAPLSFDLDVTAAGPGPAIDITVFYDDDVTPTD